VLFYENNFPFQGITHSSDIPLPLVTQYVADTPIFTQMPSTSASDTSVVLTLSQSSNSPLDHTPSSAPTVSPIPSPDVSPSPVQPPAS